MIIYTCPTCGCDLQEYVLTSLPPQYKKTCPNCGWETIEPVSEESIVRIPYESKNAIFCLIKENVDMKNAKEDRSVTVFDCGETAKKEYVELETLGYKQWLDGKFPSDADEEP